MKTGATQRPRRPQRQPDHANTPTSERIHTINQQPSTIRGEAHVPTNASWLNRIEGHFQALRYFALDGTDHRSHDEQNSMIRRYIRWRNRNTHDKTLREIVKRANVA